MAKIKHKATSSFTIRNFVIANRIKDWPYARVVDRQYAQALRQLAPDKTTDTAVAVHLYYVDAWQKISERLKVVADVCPFDIFISIPERNVAHIKQIKMDFPKAYVIVTPNRGRDVLPFFKLSELFLQYDYKYVLKLHSKKSTHRTDGEDWFNDILDSLIPEDASVLSQLRRTLHKKTTGVIGPAGQYMQLAVNFEANGVHMTRILRRIYHDREKVYRVLQAQRSEYGFFAGTMFWARLDALMPLLSNRSANSFEAEAGQIDGTFAHALERLLCVVPEVDHRKMYEIGAKGIRSIEYNEGCIPDWSNVYVGPR